MSGMWGRRYTFSLALPERKRPAPCEPPSLTIKRHALPKQKIEEKQVATLLGPRGSNIDYKNIGGGMSVIEYTPVQGQKPEFIPPFGVQNLMVSREQARALAQQQVRACGLGAMGVGLGRSGAMAGAGRQSLQPSGLTRLRNRLS